MSRKDLVLKPFQLERDYMEDRIHTGIEKNRKNWCRLIIENSNGERISGVHIKLKQLTHEFKYGASLFLLDEMDSQDKNLLYRKAFSENFNFATLPFYWKALEPEKGKPRYAKDSPKIYRRPAPDLCLEFCEKNGITPKAHCLYYDHWVPDWLPYDIDEEKKCLEHHFKELSQRYAERIPGWEVTNETLFTGAKRPMHHTPDAVEWAFKKAEKYFPENNLIINDAHRNVWGGSAVGSRMIEGGTPFNFYRSAYYMQIENLLAKGCRIDTIGMQYHMFFEKEDEAKGTANYYDPRRLYDVLDCYSTFNKTLQITEITVPAYTDSAEDEELQAEIIRNLYSIWFSSASINSIVYWNLVDGYAYTPKKEQAGNMNCAENRYYGALLRFDLSPKPAMNVIQELFNETWRTNTTITSSSDGIARFKGFRGTYSLTIKTDNKEICKEFSLTKDSSEIIVRID